MYDVLPQLYYLEQPACNGQNYQSRIFSRWRKLYVTQKINLFHYWKYFKQSLLYYWISFPAGIYKLNRCSYGACLSSLDDWFKFSYIALRETSENNEESVAIQILLFVDKFREFSRRQQEYQHNKDMAKILMHYVGILNPIFSCCRYLCSKLWSGNWLIIILATISSHLVIVNIRDNLLLHTSVEYGLMSTTNDFYWW